MYIDNAKKLWDELKERFTKRDYFRISDLIQEIHSIKQEERNVTEYFTELKILWDELDMLSPAPECTCAVKCSCELTKSNHKKQEIEQVVCFLKGLGEVYGTVKSNILMMEPLPSINKTYGLVLQQEGQLQGNNTTDSKVLFNSSNQQNNQGNWRQPSNQGRANGNFGRGRGNDYAAKQCTHCNKTGHTVDQCYFKHGFSPGFKPKENFTIQNFSVPEDQQSHTNMINPFPQASQNGGTAASQGLQLAPE